MAEQTLDRDSATPLYAQLEAILRDRIESGAWQPNERIPSENELNARFGVSRMTARGVLSSLVNDGLLFRVQGKGTFVAPRKISAKSPAYQGVREQLEELGFKTTTELVRMDRETPSRAVRERLGLGQDGEVFALERVRSVDGEPISLHQSFVPLRLARTLDQHDPVTEQLCVILDDHFGLRMKHVEESLESVLASRTIAARLGIRTGQPVLQLEDIISDARRRPFEYSRVTLRADKVRLHFSYDL